MKSFSKAKIISRQMLTEDICSLWAEVPFAGMAHAGQFVSFYLNETLYSIDIKNIKEITTSANMIPIPCTPDYISGLITVRGDFITVLNLKSFLNVNPSTYKNKSKVIIINSDVFKIGFMVDDIHDISGIYENDATKNISNNSYIKYEIVHKNDITLILDINKILEDKKLHIEEK